MNTSQYLTFEITGNGNINWLYNNGSSIHNTIEYSKNGGEWTSITATSSGVKIPVVTGDIVRFRGDNATYSSSSARYGMFQGTTCQFIIYGNIMSMISSTNFATLMDFTATYVFRALFLECTGLTDASELILPATGLTTGCYQNMFKDCSNLTIGPELPMTTLVQQCYQEMFSGCRNLNHITCLATNISASNCLYRWVYNVQTTSGTFYKNPSMTSWTRGINGVPNNWTIEDYVSFGPDVEELTFDYSGGTQSIELTSENPWTATTNDWITLSQSTGETGGVITVTVADNIFSQKIGSITFTDGENTAPVSVVQNADTRIILKNLYRNGNKVKQIFKNGEKLYQMFERFIFEVDADSFTFDYTGNTLTLTITASDPWTMTKPEWLTASSVSGMGNTTVTLTVPQNPTEDSRDGNIVLTCEGRTITITVEQKGSIGLGTPLTFEILSDGNIVWKFNGSNLPKTIEYNKNKEGWTSITSTSAGVSIPVVSGDIVQFRGDNATYGDPSATSNFNTFEKTTCQFNVKGNIMSLINSTNFKDITVLTTARSFRGLFRNCTTLVGDASNLFLPATTLTERCYSSLFENTRITTAPVLPATTLVSYCYNNLFLSCPTVMYIKCLATTNINYNSSTTNWLYNASSSGTFVKKTGVSWPSGVSGIPSGWTVLEADE